MIAFFRVVGLLLLALGIAFLVYGMNQSETFANRFLKEMAGTYPEETKRFIFWGVAMIAIGVGILFASFFRRKK